MSKRPSECAAQWQECAAGLVTAALLVVPLEPADLDLLDLDVVHLEPAFAAEVTAPCKRRRYAGHHLQFTQSPRVTRIVRIRIRIRIRIKVTRNGLQDGCTGEIHTPGDIMILQFWRVHEGTMRQRMCYRRMMCRRCCSRSPLAAGPQRPDVDASMPRPSVTPD